MYKFVVLLSLFCILTTNALADVCYDVNEKVAAKAVDIINSQEEIYEYCSICPNAEAKTIPVRDIKKSNPIYVDGNALDLAHIYYKQNNKYINLGITTGCIRAGDYNISAELNALDTHLKEKIKIKNLEQKFTECKNIFETEEKKCSELWSIKCYDHLLQANKNAQLCYKKIAIDLFKNYYDTSEADAEKRIDTFRKFLYEQYSFIYNETNYCKENNCGVSLYLYAEYATTQELHLYVNKIIGSISARD